jgi:hypothetical protein
VQEGDFQVNTKGDKRRGVAERGYKGRLVQTSACIALIIVTAIIIVLIEKETDALLVCVLIKDCV